MFPHKIGIRTASETFYGAIQIVDDLKFEIFGIPALVLSIDIGHKMATTPHSADSYFIVL